MSREQDYLEEGETVDAEMGLLRAGSQIFVDVFEVRQEDVLHEVLVLLDVVLFEEYFVDAALAMHEVHRRVDFDEGRELGCAVHSEILRDYWRYYVIH